MKAMEEHGRGGGTSPVRPRGGTGYGIIHGGEGTRSRSDMEEGVT